MTCGDPSYLEFQLDNGYPQLGNPVFNNVGNGSHTITVTDPSDPYAVPSTFDFTVNIPPCPQCLPPNHLFLAGKYDFGAPIQSVAWSCPNDNALSHWLQLAAIKVVLPDCDCASIRAYTLDTTTGTLMRYL